LKKSLPIPEQEQLEALASGLKEVWSLLSKYLGNVGKVPNSWKHITVTRSQLAEYLRQHRKLAERHISQPLDPRYHECPVLERMDDGRYRVYEMDHDREMSVQEFADLSDAAAKYLMWGFWP
jgi:hypothetical protein